MKKFLMKNFLLILLFISITTLSTHALEINTNDLVLPPTSVTNISAIPVREQRVPSTYLKTGKLEFTPPETLARRFDIIYFSAIPISFYLTLNLLFIINNSPLFSADSGIPHGLYPSSKDTPTQFRYILMNTFLIPLFVAYQDHRFMIHKIQSEGGYYSKQDYGFDMPLVSLKF